MPLAFAETLHEDFREAAGKFIATLEQRSDLKFRDLDKNIQEFRKSYLSQDRSVLSPLAIYDNEFLLRFVNLRILSDLLARRGRGGVSAGESALLLNRASIFTPESEALEVAPPDVLAFDGVNASETKLEDWESDSRFSHYIYKSNVVIFRGIEFRPGDLILNHPQSSPTGLGTVVASEPNLFSHVAMVVFLKRGSRVVPIVVDEHERGVRAVPLSDYLSPKVIQYAEVFRLKDRAVIEGKGEVLSRVVEELLHRDVPYDLSGTPRPNAMSCVELVNYIYSNSGVEPFPITSGVSDGAYPNVLSWGPIERNYVTPAQVALNPRVELIGYVDNAIPLQQMIANEAVLRIFRDLMTEKQIDMGEIRRKEAVMAYLIDRMQDPDSILGRILLKLRGIPRSLIPYGSRDFMTSVLYLNDVTQKAMNRCMAGSAICAKKLEEVSNSALSMRGFSMSTITRSAEVLFPVSAEMHDWIKLFN